MGRASYTAVCAQDDGWWAISVPEVPGALGQSRYIEGVAGTARAAIALELAVDPDSYDVAVEWRLPAGVACALEAVIRTRHQLEAAARAAGAAVDDATLALLTDADLSVRDARWILGVTYHQAGLDVRLSSESP